ncbi:MAG: TIGR02266 family protein [bacterium]|nr:TIGR02266 family protein [bacterium]
MRAQQIPTTSPPINRPLMAGSLRDNPRHQLEREVALRFRDHGQLVDAHLLNISAHGMFIRSRKSPPAGTPLRFELALTGGKLRIRGEGKIAWTRQFNLGTDRPAGMGIRFLDLDDENRRMVRSIIDQCRYRDRQLQVTAGHSGDADEVAADEIATTVGPFSGLTGSQAQALYSYAGCAKATPERGWSVRHVLERATRVFRRRLVS